jgi:hypothetical protein
MLFTIVVMCLCLLKNGSGVNDISLVFIGINVTINLVFVAYSIVVMFRLTVQWNMTVFQVLRVHVAQTICFANLYYWIWLVGGGAEDPNDVGTSTFLKNAEIVFPSQDTIPGILDMITTFVYFSRFRMQFLPCIAIKTSPQ